MSLAAALILDALMGEPDALWRRIPHPAVLLGRLVGALDQALNNGAARRAKGVAAVAALVAASYAAAWLITRIPLGPVPEIIVAAILIAQRSLTDHVTAVARALRVSTAEGRRAVAMIVGRDTAGLDEPAISRAAIESAAENFSDGVVAPAFWFAVFGLPGIVIYKAVNTADSMIGYRSARYREFGWAAARLDDALNIIPARLSALIIAAAAGSPRPMRAALRDAALHRSPNAGWPEAAMAAALNVALAGPRVYDGQQTEDPFVWPEGTHAPGPADIESAVRMLWRAWAVLLGAAVLIWIIF